MKFEDLSEGEEEKDNQDHMRYKNKHKVDEEKMNNKRLQKQANKQKKINKGKGIPVMPVKEEKWYNNLN